jgi:hypothetical protein
VEKIVVTILYAKESLEETGVPFISTYSDNGQWDIDLTNRMNVIDLVYSKWGLDYKQYLNTDMLQVLLDMEEQDFYNFVKYRWVSQEKCADCENTELYNSESLYRLLYNSTEEIYAQVLSVKNDKTLEHFECALINILFDSKTRGYNQNKTDNFHVVRKFVDKETQGKENDLSLILAKYRNMTHDKRIKMVWLIIQIKNLLGKENNNAD